MSANHETKQPANEPLAWLVEGWNGGELIARIVHMTLGEANNSAFMFSKHYSTVHKRPLYTATFIERDHAMQSSRQETVLDEDRIEAAYWQFDARHKGYGPWKQAPMSERDAFKSEMRNALAQARAAIAKAGGAA